MATTTDQSSEAGRALRVALHPERAVMRVVAAGELDAAGVRELAAQLHELRDAGFERFVLDVRNIEALDPAMIAAIVSDACLGHPDACEFSLVVSSNDHGAQTPERGGVRPARAGWRPGAE